MLTSLALVLEQPAATPGLPGMILQSSPFLIIFEGLQCAKLRLSTSVHAMCKAKVEHFRTSNVQS